MDDNLPPYDPSTPCTNIGDTYTSVQDAINDAGPGDSILIAAGTYGGGGGGAPVATISEPITVRGGFAGGSGPNSWTVPGQSTATNLNGAGASHTIVIQGAITVNLGNFTLSNGGILNGRCAENGGEPHTG